MAEERQFFIEMAICAYIWRPISSWKIKCLEVLPSCTVHQIRYMSFVDEKLKFLYKSKGDYIYNFKTGKYDHLLDTPRRDKYLLFVRSKSAYLNLYKQL